MIQSPKHKQEYKSKRIEETNTRKCLISFEKILDDKDYGLCLDKNHSHCENQNAKKYNTALIKLLRFLCERTWNDIYRIQRDKEYGHEHLPIKLLKECVQTHFIDRCDKKECDKIDVFRFGSQKFRACGFRQNDIFYLVCIDYDFSLYQHRS